MGWPLGLALTYGTIPIAMVVREITRASDSRNAWDPLADTRACLPSPDASQGLVAGQDRVLASGK